MKSGARIAIGAALALGLIRQERRALSACVAIALAGLATVYALKNPNAARYVSILVPMAAVLIGVGVASLPTRVRAAGAGAVAACALATALVAAVPPVGPDMFPGIARQLGNLPDRPIITAAPDAYGVLLRSQTFHSLREGQRGLILMDATARAYEPDLVANGRVIARISTDIGFLRPDGTLDRAPALVIDGVVTSR